MQIRDLGFDDWFEVRAAESALDGCRFARVSAVDRGSCLIKNGSHDVPAELSGRLSFRIDSPSELPCVGDWVVASYYNDDGAAIIHGVLPRKTFLRRKTAGDSDEPQMIAANIDAAFLIQSCHHDFNPSRLERYLVMAADGGVEPVVLLTKTDLVSPDELAQKVETIRGVTSARVIAISSFSSAGFEEFRQSLAPARTYCLLGSSGVGKTTLINRLMGRDAFETRTVSATGEGVHTTTRRQLVVLERGAMLVDTPGMRELGIVGDAEAVGMSFEEFTILASSCRYADCSHRHEPGCAVRGAVERGELPQERYANFMKLRKESEYHEMSSLDRRKKDKAFGKFVRSVKKQLKEK